MKRIHLLLIILLASLPLSAQNISRRLFTHTTNKGLLYFIGDKKLSKHDKGISKFVYDMTYVDTSDSATVNFSILSSNASDVASLTMSNSEMSLEASDVELLYHDIKKGKYLIRTTSRVPYAQLKRLLTSDQPLVFTVKRIDGQTNTARYSSSQWKSERTIFDKILYIIKR